MSRVCAFVFEGGRPSGRLEREMSRVRHAAALDNLEKLRQAGADEVVLCTNYQELAEDAGALGVSVEFVGPERFHFGETLLTQVMKRSAPKALVMGGASAPLMSVDDFAWVLAELRAKDRVVVMNNPQSADVIGFGPTEVLRRISLPSSDNFLGYLLREAGLQRVMVQNRADVNFDIDTPTDVLILEVLDKGGPRLMEAVRRLGWESAIVGRARAALKKEWVEVALVGRVGAPVIAHLNEVLRCRLRVFSEERGMKALGRDRRGEVTSLMGYVVDEVGPSRFFQWLSSVAEVAFIDSRVLFAHWKKDVTESDRFSSDLGRWESIEDQQVRCFTRAAVEAPIPVLLGGHSLVSGGVWLLAESVSQSV